VSAENKRREGQNERQDSINKTPQEREQNKGEQNITEQALSKTGELEVNKVSEDVYAAKGDLEERKELQGTTADKDACEEEQTTTSSLVRRTLGTNEDHSTAEHMTNEMEESIWIPIATFHELDGCKTHNHEVEGIRRGIIDSIRKNDPTIMSHMETSISGRTYWRWRAWVFMMDIHEERRDEDNQFYESAEVMSQELGIATTCEGLMKLKEWIGDAILKRCKLLPPIKDSSSEPQKTVEYEDMAVESGCCFILRAVIPLPPTDGLEPETRVRYMIEMTKVKLSIAGGCNAPHSNESPSIKFGVEQSNGERMMQRQGAEGDHCYLIELQLLIDSSRERGGLVINVQGKGTNQVMQTNSIEAMINRLLGRIGHHAESKKWAKKQQPDTLLGGLHRSLGEPFMATHCLISGISGKYLRSGILDHDGLGKISTAVRWTRR
jgi:hypothetical protein